MEYFVESHGSRLHVTEEGFGPVILLIHGVATDSSFFKKTADILADEYTVITYDRRGHSGSSTKMGEIYNAAVQAQDAVNILDAAGYEDAVVVACSAGGIVGLEMARTYPDRVSMLILHETPLAGDLEDQKAFDAFLEELTALTKEGRITKAMLSLTGAMGGMDRSAEPVPFVQLGRNLENLKVFLYEEMKEFLTYRKKHEKIELKMPCLLASGEADREGLFSKYCENAARFINCPYKRLPGYHNLAWDDPQAFADFVMEAIASIE